MFEFINISFEVENLSKHRSRVGKNFFGGYHILDKGLIKTLFHVTPDGALVERGVVTIVESLDTINTPSGFSFPIAFILNHRCGLS